MHWDEAVSALGYEHLCRHGLRQTGLTCMADAEIPVHVLRKIAGHSLISTARRYLHLDLSSVSAAGDSLTAFLRAPRP
jgi:integrase